jgi:hypothetical protein
MAILTVGPGEEYSSVSAAVAAASSGDTVDVSAGIYTNDFPTITQNLTLQAVGGTVSMVATVEPSNGKAIIDEGGPGVSVTINGFDFSGAQDSDNNGAGIRYEGGTLTLNNDTFHDNQEGLLSAPDPNGVITVDNSTFTSNGAGDGESHNIYIGDIASFTLENSTSKSAVVGHEVKSRAQNNTIKNNVIEDGSNGNSSYEIDFPNGGKNVVTNNFIQKGRNAQNPTAITTGEEGNVYANSSLTVQGNTLLNNDTGQTTYAVRNDTSGVATISGNNLFGWSVIATGSGPANASGNTVSGATPTAASLNGAADASATATAQGNTAPVTTATVASSSAAPSFIAGGSGGTQSGSSAAAVVSATYQPATSLASAPSISADPTGGTTGDVAAIVSPATSGTPGGSILPNTGSGTQPWLGTPSQNTAASSLISS